MGTKRRASLKFDPEEVDMMLRLLKNAGQEYAGMKLRFEDAKRVMEKPKRRRSVMEIDDGR
jgi:hypothetical protein